MEIRWVNDGERMGKGCEKNGERMKKGIRMEK